MKKILLILIVFGMVQVSSPAFEGVIDTILPKMSNYGVAKKFDLQKPLTDFINGYIAAINDRVKASKKALEVYMSATPEVKKDIDTARGTAINAAKNVYDSAVKDRSFDVRKAAKKVRDDANLVVDYAFADDGVLSRANVGVFVKKDVFTEDGVLAGVRDGLNVVMRRDAEIAYDYAITPAERTYDYVVLPELKSYHDKILELQNTYNKLVKAAVTALFTNQNKYVCWLYGNPIRDGNSFKVDRSGFGDWYAVAYVNRNAACSFLWRVLGGDTNYGAYILANKPADSTKLPAIGSKGYPAETERTGCGNCGETLKSGDKSGEKQACNQSCDAFE